MPNGVNGRWRRARGRVSYRVKNSRSACRHNRCPSAKQNDWNDGNIACSLTERFFQNERGAAAVEFAFVGSTFVLVILFISMVATVAYMNQSLDNATAVASRQVLTGSAQAQVPSMTSDTFVHNLCRSLPSSMNCNNLIVSLYVVQKDNEPNGYYSFVKPDLSGLVIPDLSPKSAQFTLGGRGDYQYLQVIYPITFLPSIFARLLSNGATFNGRPAYLAISTAVFKNEQF